MERFDLGTAVQFESPSWTGCGFAEREAQNLWSNLPSILQQIAIDEIRSGNRATSILQDSNTGAIVLTFEKGPLLSPPSPSSLLIHREHEVGNYCYEGTAATYEALESRCFLAFTDPNLDESAF
jgi:hypothetical protein